MIPQDWFFASSVVVRCLNWSFSFVPEARQLPSSMLVLVEHF
jgi:hypothetical protein